MHTGSQGKISAFIFDGDNTLYDQFLDLRVAAVLRAMKGLMPFGLATGRNESFCQAIGLAVGGLNFFGAENGAVFYPSRNGRIQSADLQRFKGLIRLDHEQRQCCLGEYDNELKDSILTIWPVSCGNEESAQWEKHFNAVIEANHLAIQVTRHSDSHIDIYPTSVSKKLVVDKVCKLYNIAPDNVLVFVDGLNDIKLLEGTMAVAVANAVPQIKDLVRARGGYRAKLPCGLGVLEGLYHFAELGAFKESEAVLHIIRKYCPEIAEFKEAGR